MFAVVVAKHLLIDVAFKMERLYSNVGSFEAALQERPEVLHAVDMNATAHVALSFVDKLMDEPRVQAGLVSYGVIGVDLSPVLHLAENLGLQSLAPYVRHDLSPHLPCGAVEDSLHNSFARCTAACFVANFLVSVHILLLTADESLIRFNFALRAADLGFGSKPLCVQRQAKANAVHHEPCRLLGNSDGASNLVRADAVLAIGQKPNGSEPLVGGDRRILHDGADLRGELALWVYALALPLALILQEYNVYAPTGRAGDDAIRPAKADHIGQNIIRVSEMQDRRLQSLWLLLFAVHVTNYNAVRLIRQVYSYHLKGNSVDVWLLSTNGAGNSRFTFEPVEQVTGVWSRDGTTLAYRAVFKGGATLFAKRASGLEREKPLLQSQVKDDLLPNSWSADGQQILCEDQAPTHSYLALLPAAGGAPVPFLNNKADENNGQISPDGKWVAYASDESGIWEIYVTSFPGAAGKWQVSRGGGTEPRWRGDSKEIFYIGPGGKLMAVPVNSGSVFATGTPAPLFQIRGRAPISSTDIFTYDVAKDGKRFLVNRYVKPEHVAPLTILLQTAAGSPSP